MICANDMLALGLETELLRSGLRIPHDIAIVGYDDLVWASVASVPLTTVRQPVFDMAMGATDGLLRLLAGEEAPPPVMHTHELLIRGTTAPPK